ncbi:DUF4136 domain-containing protein [Cytophagaceae bacterium DM2B3-1]|uniref:DUF4136 domain-containing protein n=1 Tax=Xanthocytophaga flava TaxID=3048013 RepID=A0ABT7CP78_9BACT|nr:DUF4136 domain-containing protein [Xanthocytophaga flavus]MDJ1495505.1 DUF4136 domain-containing protein [Xanthocytophaga flavus]
MRTIIKSVVYTLCIVWATTCGLGQVATDYDKNVDFSKFKTFAWMKEDIQVGSNPLYTSKLINRNIKEHVELELVKRGLMRVNPDQSPDLLISFHTYTEKKHMAYNYGSPMLYPGGYRMGWWYYPWGYGNWPYAWNSNFRSYNYTEGTLIVDVIEASTKELIWRGSASGVIDTPKRLEKQITKGVTKIMKHYPVTKGEVDTPVAKHS